jgi:hypothetical protein
MNRAPRLPQGFVSDSDDQRIHEQTDFCHEAARRRFLQRPARAL